MTQKSFWLYALLQFVILTLLKIWFFAHQVFANPGIQATAFWLLCALLGIALIRRIGIINYFEAMYVILIWVVGDLLIDLIVTSNYTGTSIFSSSVYWSGIVALAAGSFFLHKKRHVAIRKGELKY